MERSLAVRGVNVQMRFAAAMLTQRLTPHPDSLILSDLFRYPDINTPSRSNIKNAAESRSFTGMQFQAEDSLRHYSSMPCSFSQNGFL